MAPGVNSTRLESAALPESTIIEADSGFFLIEEHGMRYLMIASSGAESGLLLFEGEELEIDGKRCMKCPTTHHNASALRERFPHMAPVTIGKVDSFGFGDRLGNAGTAHLRAVRETPFMPVLAQQSVRELQRTGRTPEEVLDAATWAVFETGYRKGFGADGDHLKTEADIDLMLKAGYTMLTLDPSDHVVGSAATMDDDQQVSAFRKLPWDLLELTPDRFLKRYSGFRETLSANTLLEPTKREIVTAMIKYGKVIAHTVRMANYINESYPDLRPELELSVDETDHPTTLFEHWLIASELNRLGVDLVSLAPRFSGEFEKGVDFRGDLNHFTAEYEQHLAIARKFGGYKLSIHSGSDKFTLYQAIGSLNQGAVHVKTAGTSYLEALRTVAYTDPVFFKELMEFSMVRFDSDKKSYHISGRVEEIPPLAMMQDEKLRSLLDHEAARQVLHVTYGSVLNSDEGQLKQFKTRLMTLLSEQKNLYEQFLQHHFERHLKPFAKA